MKKAVLSQMLWLFLVACPPTHAQVFFSSGPYTQNFDSLANSGTTNVWADNLTIAGWYASKSKAGTNVTTYRADNGAIGALYSYGTNAATERALGSTCSGTPGNFAYGVRMVNDLPTAQTNITISYMGEQWRNGGNTNAQRLAFSYRVGTSLTNADAPGAQSWVSLTNADFISPTIGASSVILDGNIASNQVPVSAVVLSGVAVLPGYELFLRWFDIDDGGNDHGLAIDDLTVSFSSITVDVRKPSIVNGPQDVTVTQGAGASFSVTADGAAPLSYQWQLNGTNLTTATNALLSLSNVTGNNAGLYTVIVTNAYGTTNASATLTVNSQVNPTAYGLFLMTYNVKGNGATNWTTNAPQVQAIGRQVQYLQPDVITFNEIPYPYTYEMTNFMKVYLPGYYLVTNSGTDNYIRSAIASKYPITRSTKWLDGAQLEPFDYTNANFTRDLFEAQINVPDFDRPLHVFTTHLKSSAGGYLDAANKRAAEAAAITNFFATNFFVRYPNDPYTLSGDFNESDTNTLALQRLLSPEMGLRLTNPTNPFTGTINTYSIQGNVNERIDYIMPCGLLASNIVSSQVFRTDLLNPVPGNLQTNDDKTASDHLPVLMYFRNPYDVAYRISSISLTNQLINLNWQSVTGRQYRVDSSSNLLTWVPIRTNTAVTTNSSFSTNTTSQQFFRIYRVP